MPLKKGKSIWTARVEQSDESEFAYFYVKRLFRRNYESKKLYYRQNGNSDPVLNMNDEEFTSLTKPQQSRARKFLNSIYHWDDEFRFTTMATCTYTVAIVFLYYLACTFVFLYVSRTTGHVLLLRYFIESLLHIGECRSALNIRQFAFGRFRAEGRILCST
jgi:hypothetical protein